MKVVQVSAALSLTLGALALGGCSTELDGFGAKPSAVASNRVLTAPTGSVESAPAPANVSASTAETATGAITPRSTASNVPLTPPAANPGGTAYAASPAQGQLSGAWTFTWDDGRNSCPLKLSTDRGLSGLSAQADVSCPSEIFMTKGWDMMGSDIVLQNHQGKVTARLQPSGPNRYVGLISESNQQVSLSR
ncbi:UNVERIFIED_ORG: hypothetical protein ABID33_002364 [Xanthobacter viscosus]|uniref:Alkaline proteinase inhibitor/ Outer membrane lipoprotein Omp19 domain-containing protein n=1 Tax=Xanthobacter autotrophicus TaxID=280 RepID=A0A6C1KBF7_XANAU|nr:protease inhibitor Inh/omp19 family protein [Xanthobacter autotrophicus]TLX41480.1 hypothetical protein FBQ73_18655 [Xanthobacter autotrophicus]